MTVAPATNPIAGPTKYAADQNVLGHVPSGTYPVHPAWHVADRSELPRTSTAIKVVTTNVAIPSTYVDRPVTA
jgi:hypothetical protein